MPLCKQDTKLKMIFGSKWSIFYEIATFSIWELKTLIESESLVEHISFSNYLFAALLSIHIHTAICGDKSHISVACKLSLMGLLRVK